MHECPKCGQACKCLGDDTWDDTEADECQCACEDWEYEEHYDPDYGDFDEDER
jgi:hypothetical protein